MYLSCDETLPEIYDRELFQTKCNDLYNHFYDYEFAEKLKIFRKLRGTVSGVNILGL